MQSAHQTAGTLPTDSLVIYQRDNNIDGKDNLSLLPRGKAVYALSGRINGQPANYRMVGITDNLQQSIKQHFSSQEKNECLKTFMQSIKIKMLTYRLAPDMSAEDMDNTLKEWQEQYKPDCNEQLNEVY